MELTDHEIVVNIEALREYRLRVADPSRHVVCDALIYRYAQTLIENNKQRELETKWI